MSEHRDHQAGQENNTHPLPKGVIQAGINSAEAAANQDLAQRFGEPALINTDAMVPVSAERTKLNKIINKAKNIGRTALEQLPFGGSVSWQPEKPEDTKNE